MSYRKKLIEVAIPLQDINIAASREKSLRHGHPSTFHLWWSRKPLAAARAVLLASLLDDPSNDLPESQAQTERERLFDAIRSVVQWEDANNPTNIRLVRDRLQEHFKNDLPTVFDPFSGGGSIPLEALRLGLDVMGADLNPVACLLTKSMIEIPSVFRGGRPVHPSLAEVLVSEGGTSGLAADVLAYGMQVMEEAYGQIGHLYPKGVNGEIPIAWLWARTVTCPNPACGVDMPLTSSWVLSSKNGREAWVEPIYSSKHNRISYELRFGKPPKSATTGTYVLNQRGKPTKSTFECPICHAGVMKGEDIQKFVEGYGFGSSLIAVAYKTKAGRIFSTELDEVPNGINEAITVGSELESPCRGTFASNAQGRNYGFYKFRDYFTPRQLRALSVFSELVTDIHRVVLNDALKSGMSSSPSPLNDGGTGARAYADAVITYLAVVIDRCADRWSSLASWDVSRDNIRNTFSLQGISMMWDYAEANPFSGASGSYLNALKWVVKVIERLPTAGTGKVTQSDAAETWPTKNVVVSTDPPYYDNVSYSDLSDFFYVWLRKILKGIYPDLFKTLLTPKYEELVASSYRFDGNGQEADRHFKDGLGRVFDEVKKGARRDIPVTIFYAFKQSETNQSDSGAETIASTGWEAMLQGLCDSGFQITGTWPMRTELTNRAGARDANSLASSIVLVCRIREECTTVITRKEFLEQLRTEVPRAIKVLQSSNIAAVDLAQSIIGPGMRMFSQYERVLEANGNKMTVRTALELINQILDEVMNEQEGEYDSLTRWAYAWYLDHHWDEKAFGEAETLAKARNISVKRLRDAEIVLSAKGKTRLLKPEELDERLVGEPTSWYTLHRMVHVLLNEDGEDGAARLLAQHGVEDSIRALAYSLYQVCDREGRATEALGYNALVTSWPSLVRKAREFPTAQKSVEVRLDI